ncbi:MAG TPA: acyl-CoA carboxylase subunit epsilon [Microlunatus sp.]
MTEDPAPVLRVVSGRPSADELAAVVVVFSALTTGSADSPKPAATGGWSDRSRGLRTTLRPGPDGWRLSGR